MRDIIMLVIGVVLGVMLTGHGWILTLGVILGIALVVAIVLYRAFRPAPAPRGGRRR
jgi:hypothetical protein